MLREDTMNPAMITIVKMIETCSGCPSQWDGWDVHGRYYYFRYRWGTLRVDATPTEEAWPDRAETIYCEEHGDSLDGIMSYDILKTHLASLMTLPDYCELYGENKD